MIRFRVAGDGLQRMNLRWWTPTQREWVPLLIDDNYRYQKRQQDPTYGQKWASLAPSTAKWKAKHFPGEPILRRTGAMLDGSYIFTRGRDQFLVRTTRYGAFNQFGTSKMSARPWMGVPDDSLKQIVPISWKNILRQY
jgi:phage gpG-like protein